MGNNHPPAFIRRSGRLEGYDYSTPGAYAITSCTQKRYPYFNIPPLKRIIEEQWFALPQRFPSITLDTFIIMPDHIHGIIILNEDPCHQPTLGRIVMCYKSITSYYWREYRAKNNVHISMNFWQYNYYDHIIRNDRDLQNQREYILSNPLKELEKFPERL